MDYGAPRSLESFKKDVLHVACVTSQKTAPKSDDKKLR